VAGTHFHVLLVVPYLPAHARLNAHKITTIVALSLEVRLRPQLLQQVAPSFCSQGSSVHRVDAAPQSYLGVKIALPAKAQFS
jgi:hypothetical protein